MTVLELDPDVGLASTRVLAVMHYPDPADDQYRARFAVADHVGELAKLEAKQADEDLPLEEAEAVDELFKRRLAALFRDGGFPAVWQGGDPAGVIDAALKREVEGHTAGQILLCLLAFANNPRRRQHATVRRAVFTLEQGRKARPQRFAGKRVPASQSWILRAWSRFKPAAHLWAAARLEAGFARHGATEDVPLARFLSLSEEVARRTAQLAVPWPFDAENAWRLPEGTRLPEVRFQVPSINRAQILVPLRKYKARR